MKFKILRSKLIEGLKYVQNIIPSKSSIPVLQNVLLEVQGKELTMTTTDLDISIRCTVECTVDQCGVSTLPVKFLSDIINKAPEVEIEIEIDANEKGTIIAGASAKSKLKGLPAVEFPKLAEREEEKKYTLPQQVLREMLRKTSYAASSDDTRRTLKGVLMRFKDGKLTMVATDGRRLALVENEVDFPQDAEKDIILPSKTVQELQRSLVGEEDVVVRIEKSLVWFTFGNVTIYSKFVDDVYPNYVHVIPAECSEQITIERLPLLSALERASVMTMDEAHSVRLIFENGKLIVTSSESDMGEAKDEVPIKYAGERIEIIFNPNYVMEPLRAIDDDEIQIHMNNGHSPAVIKCSIPFIYVLMPLRIN